MHVLLIPKSAEPSPRLVQAFPDARVARPPYPEPLPSDTAICWIGTDLAGWLDEVRGRCRTHRLVVHSMRPTDDEGIAALDAGAHGYCHSLAAGAQLRAVALTVLSGGLWVGPSLIGRMIRTIRRSQPEDPAEPPAGFDQLTPREREVALAVTTGASNKEIARQLGLSERTVKMHLGAAFQKLGVDDRVQLVLCLMRVSDRKIA
jgi:DNA-binding NarL/FixJ family response regulator